MSFKSTDSYFYEQSYGWVIRVANDLKDEHQELYENSIRLLKCKLFDVKLRIPNSAYIKLLTIRIWLEYSSETREKCAAFHPDRQYLINKGFNPDKAGCVEIANAANFIEWSKEQPMMILHELTHAYHITMLTPEQKTRIKTAYSRVKNSSLYDNILRYSGRREKGYFLTVSKNNEEEFFAELSEAFFGTNDYFPFVRAELKQHDPDTFKMLQELWGDPNP